MTVQLLPFHCEIRSPTPKISAPRAMIAPPALPAVGTCDQLAPSQWIIKIFPVTVEPTAHTSLDAIMVTLSITPNGDSTDDGIAIFVQLLPSQCWTMA